jgi:hypothetical protein
MFGFKAPSLGVTKQYTNEQIIQKATNSPTKDISFDGGIYSVGNDVVNGQVSDVRIKGQTWTNLAGAGDTSPQTVENLDAAKTYLLINSEGANVTIDTVDTPTPVKLTGATSFDFGWASGEIALYELSTEEATLEASVLGQKYHYVSGTKSTNSVRVKSVGKNLFDVKSCEGKTGWQVDPVRVIGTGIEVSGYIPSGVGYAYIPYKLKPNTQYTISYNAINNQGATPALGIRNSNNEQISAINGSGKKQKTFMTDSVGSGSFLFYSAALPVPDAGVYTTIYNDIQLEPGTVATEYEPYKESIVNVNLPEPLRSVPNGVKDEIRVSGGKAEYIQRTRKYVLQESDIVTVGDVTTTISIAVIRDFTDSVAYLDLSISPVRLGNMPQIENMSSNYTEANIGAFFTASSGRIGVIMPFGTTLTQAREQLTGTPLTYQLEQPIITKLPAQPPLQVFENGTVYVEPISDPAETTLPSVEMTIPTGTNNKFGVATHDYGGAAADWVLTKNEANCGILIVTNAGGAANIIVPNDLGRFFFVKNDSGYDVVVKSAGAEAGTTIADGNSVIVFNTGD